MVSAPLAGRRPLRCIAIMGATATGKSRLALGLAENLGGEIVSMDSRQVYRGMDIGTAKPSLEDRETVRHYLIDILNPDEPNAAGKHAQRALAAVESIRKDRKVPILVGGTGFYFRALFEGLIEVSRPAAELEDLREEFSKTSTAKLYARLERVDPKRARVVSMNDRVRISRALEVFLLTGRTISEHFSRQEKTVRLDALKIVLTLPRGALRESVERRTREMFSSGWVDEVKRLLEDGYTVLSAGMNSLGYREIAQALESGRNPYEDLPRIVTLTRQYAKRQETFFRREKDAAWFDVSRRDWKSRVEDFLSASFPL